MIKNVIMTFCLCLSTVVFAQENEKLEQLDSVVIDTKTPIARKNSGKVVVKITSETLNRSAGKSVAQIINEVSGIEINGSRSNDGQNLGYFIRGGRNRQMVIMMDGVQLNDPSQISNDYDLRLIPALSIESIEIVKGASSVLYGSGAGTAVISIRTKQASKEAISASFTSSIGTNRAAGDKDSDLEEFTNYASVNGTLSSFYYQIDFSNRYVNGLSAVSAPDGEENFEEDVFNRYNGKANLGYAINEKIIFSRFFSFDKFKAGFDDFTYTDVDNISISDQKRTGGNFQWKYKKGSLIINDSYSWIDREIKSSFPSRFDAKSYTFDAYGSYQIDEEFNVLMGLNGNFSSFNSYAIPFGETNFMQSVSDDLAHFDIIDPYLNASYFSSFGLNINAGLRLNNHSNYGNHIVYNVNPSYNINMNNNNLKLLASYSTAYITPSLFQLYDPLYGNIDLQPEENTTIEAGLEYTTEKNLRVSAVYFIRDESNFVDFITVDPDLFIFQYQNISDDFTASGVEVEVAKKFGDMINLTANYTYTMADERFALRIPEHKANVAIAYIPSSKIYLGINYQYNSEREDAFFNQDTFMNENITLDSYGLLDFNVSYQVTSQIKIFANVGNILDEDYEELYRFQTKGRNFRFGFTLEF